MKIFYTILGILILSVGLSVVFQGNNFLGSTGTFPTSLSVWASGDTISSSWANLLEGKVGIDDSAVSTSLDYQLNNSSSVDPGHLHTSSGISGQISASAGGTGIGSYATGDILYASSPTALSKLAIGSTGELLTVASGLPSWVAGGAGITNINGLTGLIQYFATGSSGTDFNIASASVTHTFNLPSASAVNRGALTSDDWTTFNNKLSTASAASTYQTILTNSAGLLAALNDETGTSLAVFNTSPTLVTPILGVAQGTSFNGLTLATASVGFTIAGGTTSKTLTVDETKSLSNYLLADGTRDITNLTITNNATASTLSIGGAKFLVDSSGNITAINNVTTSFPSAQGAMDAYLKNDGIGGLTWTKATRSISVTIASPSATEDIQLIKIDNAMTILKMETILVPSVVTTQGTVWTIRHGTDRGGTGNEVITGGTYTTATRSVQTITSFNDATVPAGSFLWLETTLASDSIINQGITIKFRDD